MRVETPQTLPEPAAVERREVRPRGEVPPPDGKSSPPESPPTPAAVRRAAEDIERFLRDRGREFAFSVDDTTGRTIVAIRDASTGELIRQIPSEEALRIARNLDTHVPALVRARA